LLLSSRYFFIGGILKALLKDFTSYGLHVNNLYLKRLSLFVPFAAPGKVKKEIVVWLEKNREMDFFRNSLCSTFLAGGKWYS